MSRTKKNKIFDLFKSAFKITLFYKPTLVDGDVFYYVVLDDVLRLKIKEVSGVVVIDDVIPLTTTYINPVYEQVVRCVMGQSDVTVLVALTGNAFNIQQACIKCNAPIVDDERYITVSNGYYNKLKNAYLDDMSMYGFYILSVSDEEDQPTKSEPFSRPQENGREPDTDRVERVKSINNTPIGVEPPISKVGKSLTKNLKATFRGFNIEPFSNDSIRCNMTRDEYFSVEVTNSGIYIKELLQRNGTETELNLIKIMDLVMAFQQLLSIHPNVYILSVQNGELNSICNAKKFPHIMEEQRLPMNKLFRQAFHGYGTYQVLNN